MFYSEETQLSENQIVIDTFWQENVIQTTLAFAGFELAYAYTIPASAQHAIVISSGRIECLLKYKELIWELYHNNYAVFIMDHPGQGLSSRQLSNLHKGYIEDFFVYVDAFSHFNNTVVEQYWQGEKTLLAHSMGSAIAALYLQTHPDKFKRAIFCAPMFGIHFGSLPNWFAKCYLNLLVNIGQKTAYLPGQGDYCEKPFEENQLTQSEIRYQLFRSLYRTFPTIQLGGVTAAWLKAALIAMQKIAETPLNLEILLLQAADDEIVDNQAQDLWLSRQPHASLVQYKKAKHELLCAQDSIRRSVMSQIYDFLAPRTTDKGS